MPDFDVKGSPGEIRSRAQVTSAKAQTFYDTGDALSKIDASGWTGRAADHFRDAHDLEPDRWFKAGNGFAKAGAALTTYAGQLEGAQEVAVWAEGEYARGEQATASARSAYDADVSDGRLKLATGVYSSLRILPFEDPGAAIRSHALAELASARATLDNAAHVCAGEVRAGCADAPEEPNWLESGLKFVGGIFEGAGEALWDLATMMPFSPINMINDTWKLATGKLTPEELLARYELTLEQATDMFDALRDDPVEFGKALGKGLLDWDTWADDPARALGHLVPDAIAAAFTAGTAGAATRGAGAIDDVADGVRALERMGDVSDLRRLENLGDLGDVERLIRTPLDDLLGDPDAVRALTDARNGITVEPGTPMQRVITESDVHDYLGGASNNEYFRPDATYGFTARQEDVSHLRTPQEMFDGLGLDYLNSPHRSPGDVSHGPNEGGIATTDMHYLRYEADGAHDVIVPRHSQLGGDGTFDAQALDPHDPFTGNGYTKGGVPEFKTHEATDLSVGSEIWRADAAGQQHLVAVLTESPQGLSWLAVPR